MLVLVAASGIAGGGEPRSDPSVEVDADLGLASGYDSNPLEVSGDGPGAAFAEATFHAGVRVPLGQAAGVFAESEGVKRTHESRGGGADSGRARLRAGFALPDIRAGRSRISVAAGGFHEIRRSTFTDRVTGNVYEVPADPPTLPPTSVPVPDRFDSDTRGAFLDLHWRIARRTRLFLSGTLEHADYVEDYEDGTSLDPLDHRAVILEPGVAWLVGDALVVEGSVVLSEIDFDRLSAVDGSGNEVLGTAARYRYAEYRLRARWAASSRWRLGLGIRTADRRDTYAGYYDFQTWSAFLAAERSLGRRSRVRALAWTRRQDYEDALVAGDPNGEVRGTQVRRFTGRFEHALARPIELFVEAGTQSNDSRDPAFAHDRDWALAGVEFRLRSGRDRTGPAG